MNIYNNTWKHEEFSITFFKNNSTTHDISMEISIDTNEHKEKILLPIIDILFLIDLNEGLIKLLSNDYRSNSVLLSSTQKVSDDTKTLDCYLHSFVSKEEIGEPLIDGQFISIERFDYEIKEHFYDNFSLLTSYRITLGIPYHEGSSVFKSFIINDIKDSKIKELSNLIDSLINPYLEESN